MQRQLDSKFTMQGFYHALNIFSHSTDTCGDNKKLKCTAVRYLFQNLRLYGNIYRNYPKEKVLREHCIQEFELAFRQNNREAMSEFADIYYTFATENRDELLKRIRRISNPMDPRVEQPMNSRPQVTIYSDSQNVHNSTLNKSVISVAKTLVKTYKEIIEADEKNVFENILNELVLLYPDKKKIITQGFQFISESVFKIDEITLPKLLIAIWLFIINSTNKKDLECRLLEELNEMKGKCTTGYIARLVNVIQGYTDDKNLQIRISDKDQCRAVVRSYLMKKLSECQDEKIIDTLTENADNPEYIRFIRKVVSERLIVWKQDYGEESLELIGLIINEFTGKKIFEDT